MHKLLNKYVNARITSPTVRLQVFEVRGSDEYAYTRTALFFTSSKNHTINILMSKQTKAIKYVRYRKIKI